MHVGVFNLITRTSSASERSLNDGPSNCPMSDRHLEISTHRTCHGLMSHTLTKLCCRFLIGSRMFRCVPANETTHQQGSGAAQKDSCVTGNIGTCCRKDSFANSNANKDLDFSMMIQFLGCICPHCWYATTAAVSPAPAPCTNAPTSGMSAALSLARLTRPKPICTLHLDTHRPSPCQHPRHHTTPALSVITLLPPSQTGAPKHSRLSSPWPCLKRTAACGCTMRLSQFLCC